MLEGIQHAFMPNLHKVAELTAIASSAAGVIVAAITEQIIYAVAPVPVALMIGSINRHRLDQQLKTEQHSHALQVEALTNQIPSEIQAQVNRALHESEASFEHVFTRADESKNSLHFGRDASRELLIEAFTKAEKELVLVCPWLTKFAINSVVLHHLQAALYRDVVVQIGWGRLQDLQSGEYHKNAFYDALPLLQQLARQHSNLKLKPIGTHEKFLVCDRKFAVVSSHNFLTSDEGSEEREVSLRTIDATVINQLLQSYETTPAVSLANTAVVKLKTQRGKAQPTELTA